MVDIKISEQEKRDIETIGGLLEENKKFQAENLCLKKWQDYVLRQFTLTENIGTCEIKRNHIIQCSFVEMIDKCRQALKGE